MKVIRVDSIDHLKHGGFKLNLSAHTGIESLIVPSHLIRGELSEQQKEYSVFDYGKDEWLVEFWLADGVWHHPSIFFPDTKVNFNKVVETEWNRLIAVLE